MGFDPNKDLIPVSQFTKSDAPYELTLEGVTYTHMKGTERFANPSNTETFTFYQLLQKHFADQFKSKNQKIEMPESIYQIARAGRYRILRAVQMHYDPPPQLDEVTCAKFEGALTAIESSMETDLTLPSQFSYARWAAHGDPNTAFSLILHYGWATTPRRPIEAFCLYKLIEKEDGIVIDIEYAHTFQERLSAACRECLQYYLNELRLGQKPQFAKLEQVAVQKFFFYKNRYVSATPEFNTMIKAHLQHYISQIMNDKTPENVPEPVIDEPQNVIENQYIEAKWTDFKFAKITAAQAQQRNDNNKASCLEAFQRQFGHLPENTPLTLDDLGRPSWRTITSGKKHGFLRNPKRGIYTLHLTQEGG